MTKAVDLVRMGRYYEAIKLLERGEPADAQTVLAYGKAMEMTGQPKQALALYKSLNTITPCEQFANNYAASLARLGLRDPEELDRLIAAYPSNAFLRAAKGEMALMDGDLSTGFKMQADRFAVGGAFTVRDQIKLPDWDGGELDGRLLVVGEQGLGEEVLFSSAFDQLPPAIISCDQRLIPLFSRSFPRHVFVHRSAIRHYHGDACCHAMDAFAKVVMRDGYRHPQSWLKPNADLTGRLRPMMAASFPDKLLVGLSWFSARKNLSESKSIPVDQLPGLFGDDCAMLNLQYGDIGDDVRWLEERGSLVYAIDGIDVTNDLDGLAALIASLDVVVTCSNTVAHFAGALGKRTILLAPSRFRLWYWGSEGEATKWYPSIHVIRETDWCKAISRARSLL